MSHGAPLGATCERCGQLVGGSIVDRTPTGLVHAWCPPLVSAQNADAADDAVDALADELRKAWYADQASNEYCAHATWRHIAQRVLGLAESLADNEDVRIFQTDDDW